MGLDLNFFSKFVGEGHDDVLQLDSAFVRCSNGQRNGHSEGCFVTAQYLVLKQNVSVACDAWRGKKIKNQQNSPAGENSVLEGRHLIL